MQPDAALYRHSGLQNKVAKLLSLCILPPVIPSSSLRRLLLAHILSFATCSVAMASSHLVFFGTYTRSTSRGIYAARLDGSTGALTNPVLVAETSNPTWITFSPDRRFLYASHGSRAQAIAYAVDRAGPTLTALPGPAAAGEKASNSCHLSTDATGTVLVTANYGDGFVSALRIHANGTLGEPTAIRHTGHGPNPQRQEKPHVHSVTISPDNRHVVVCDLGLDRIFTYALDGQTATLATQPVAVAEAQPCSGPRHFKFSRDGKYGYALTEMGATIEVYDYEPESGSLARKQIISTLPSDYQAKWGAEVRLHPNGRFLYASNRGHDSLAVFAINAADGTLSLVEIVSSGGKVPRNFELSPDGQWLVCAHQEAGGVHVFRVDETTGKLTKTPQVTEIAMAVCVAFLE